jgi:hypothetical protein
VVTRSKVVEQPRHRPAGCSRTSSYGRQDRSSACAESARNTACPRRPVPQRSAARSNVAHCALRGQTPPPQANRVVGAVSSSRAISRVRVPSPTSSTILILNSRCCSVVEARSRASSSACSSGLSRTFFASGIIPILNPDPKPDCKFDSLTSDTGY